MTESHRRSQLIESISQRLEPLCARMGADEFARLVTRIADIRVEHERKSGSYDWRSAGPAMADLGVLGSPRSTGRSENELR